MIYKRGRIYWYRFMWQGKLVRESTHQGNDKVARQMEAGHKARLADEAKERERKAVELGCAPRELLRCPECEELFNAGKASIGAEDKKFCSEQCRKDWVKRQKPIPTLAEFVERRFEPWARSTFEASSPKTWRDFYRVGMRAILAYKPLSSLRLDEITSEHATGFAAWRQAQGCQVSTVNSSVRVLRRILGLAVEWGLVESVPKIKKLPGERHREHVVAPEEEARYLAAAPEPLASVAAVLVDSGMRPEELFRLRWEHITWVNGRFGSLLVTHGKTAAARRMLPMTPRVRSILEARWEAAGRPVEGWVWPAPTHSAHLEPSSLKKQHQKALRLSKVRPFVLYSLRHTFLTRLGESGCDAWTLARIAGHSSVAISSRYVHPSEQAVLAAVERLSGHNSGHSEQQAVAGQRDARLLTT